MAIELQVGALGAEEQTDLRRALWNHTSKVALSRTTTLPGSPAVGDIYIVRSDVPGTANQIAFYYDAGWQLLVPEEGWTAYVVDDGENVQFDGADWIVIGAPDVRAINFVIDGGGAEITTGIKGDLQVPFPCAIESVTLLADQTGSIQIDIWKDSYGSFPPVDADSITASSIPVLSGAAKSTNSTLTGWTTAIADGDVLRYNVDSVATVTRVTVVLKVRVT